MPVELAAFTADELAAWLQAELGAETATLLGWTTAGDFTRVIAATVRTAGLSTIEEASDESALLAYARLALWGAARKALVSAINLGYADGDRFDREALYKHAAAEYDLAVKEVDAIAVTAAPPTLQRYRVRRHDPMRDRLTDPCRRWS